MLICVVVRTWHSGGTAALSSLSMVCSTCVKNMSYYPFKPSQCGESSVCGTALSCMEKEPVIRPKQS